MKFEKIYTLDTNILLDNAQNLLTLSQDNKNLIVIPETVLDEIDSKKSGFDEINFQAREFGRLLFDAQIINNFKEGHITIIETEVKGCTIYIISKEEYKADSDNVASSIRNDRKILEITKEFKELNGWDKTIFLSLDVMARTRAISIGIETEVMNLGKTDVKEDIEFHNSLYIEDYSGNVKDIPSQEEHISSIEISNKDGKVFVYFRSINTWELIPDKNSNRIPLPPVNKKQKILSELILDKTDVVVCTGPAGTGKTVIALASAMRLIDLNKDVYNKIYYIRRTVISGSTEDELGFLPGSLEEKMMGYNQPMADSIKKIASNKKTKQSKEDLELAIERIHEKYDIEYLYAGHLRGSTLDEGSILICDETQNWDIPSIRTIFSRVSKNSMVIALGSNNQIDSKYLTKNTNALTFLTSKCGSENESDVSIKGVKLTNVMRSKISEWADLELM